jgi:hypothetical protein
MRALIVSDRDETERKLWSPLSGYRSILGWRVVKQGDR